VTLLALVALLLFSCATPPSTDLEIDTEASVVEDSASWEAPLDEGSAEVTKDFLQTLSTKDFVVDEEGVPYLLVPAGHRGSVFLSNPESIRALIHVQYTQHLGEQSLSLTHVYGLDGQNFVGAAEEGWIGRLEILESKPSPGILPDVQTLLTIEARVVGQTELQWSQEDHHTLLETLSMEWNFEPLIIPDEFETLSLNDLPVPLGTTGPGLFVLFPDIVPYQEFGTRDLEDGAIRFYGPDEQALPILGSFGGGFYTRSRSSQGFFLPNPAQGAWFPIPEQKVLQSGFGTSLPLNGRVLPETLFRSAPVLGADRYEFLSGGVEIFPLQSDSVQRSSEPTFQLPGHSSVVFSALANGRPLIEVSYTLELFTNFPRFIPLDSPGFQGQVMEFPLTNSELAGMASILIDHDLLGGSDLFVDPLSSSVLLGLGDLDFGQQFGIVLDPGSGLSPVADRENHPAVGVSWHGAKTLGWLLSNLRGMTQRVFPSPYFEDSGFRLPTEAQWLSFSETRAGFRPSRETVNYFRSFDPFEDPNPPHTRMGGPTSPRGTFPPDSIYGLYDTRGNVWEWTLDTVPEDELPTLATGEVDQTLVYRRVMGGAWNTTLATFGPRGLEVPRGRFAQDHMSWSIGVRFIY